MSAPQTDPEKQRRRHWVPLMGMALAAVFGIVVILYWLMEEAALSDPPQPASIEAPSGGAVQPQSGPTAVIEPEAQGGPGQSPTTPPTVRMPPAAD